MDENSITSIIKLFIIATTVGWLIARSNNKNQTIQTMKYISLEEIQKKQKESFERAFNKHKNTRSTINYKSVLLNKFNILSETIKLISIFILRVTLFCLILFCIYSIVANIIHINIILAVAWTLGAIASYFIFLLSF